MGHPSKTAKRGNIRATPIKTGVHADFGPLEEGRYVYCKQCGFPCHLGRDARNVDQFAGETIRQSTQVTDHGYLDRSEQGSGIYDGDTRVTSLLSNEISNGSFENWTAGNPDNWTVSGSVSQNSTDGYYDRSDDGLSSLEATRNGSDISISQSPSTPSDFNQNTVRFKARVKCATFEVVRLRIDVNGQSYYSAYNRGQQRFEDVGLSVLCPASVSSITVYILLDSQNATAYIDDCVLTRSGNTATASVTFGCPMCGSTNYF
jgi:hypothetical protein